MTVLDVAPQVYYDAAVACNTAASGFINAFQNKMQSLDETRGMAGSIGDGKIWAESYDQQASDMWKISLDLTMALDGYAQVLNQAGYNHALADHDPAGGRPEPQLPSLAAAFGYTPLELLSTIPPSAGGDGRGLVDDGLELATKVGIPIPDGDTAKLSHAADVWHTLSTHESVTAVATELERAAVMFEQVTSPDASFIDEDLRELKTVASDLAGAYGEMAQSCRDQKQAHDALRAELERLLGDLAKEIAVEVAVSLALSVLVSCVSFGVGAAAVAARTTAAVARIIDKFADLIKIAVKAAKLRTAVVVERVTTKTKGTVQRIKDLTVKLIEKIRNKVPKNSLTDELSSAQVWTGRTLPTKGPPNGYLVKKDANGNITHYSYFDEDGIATKRVDLTGKPHYDKATGQEIPTPHVVEVRKNVNPKTGEKFGQTLPDSVRPALPEEIP
ncbi:polymorphic toxin type 24 domain-containing protein [Nocardia sputi]|uniref:polymorphic toxin type 24 domain-containing protein n=1 Tax=Nocardia sputi TaxID=2943705 RepID=UPI0020BFF8E5|nr:polymorphic toxin type 24 domain-containing protein [Nocardia sputi]